MSSETALGTAPLSLLADLMRLARPKDWLKSVFVLMPLPFAVASGAELALRPIALGLAGMCLVSSAVYALNDVLDAERDRASERKRERPVASRRLSRQSALAAAAVWAATGLLLGQLSGQPGAPLILAVYAALNVLYSFGAKHVPLVDVSLISSGFVLRVVLGCVLVGVAPSSWLLLCSSSLALLLALGKRRGELIKGWSASQRPALEGYTRGFLDQAMGIVAGITIFGYALYCIETRLLIHGREFAALPFAVFGVLEYLRLVQVRGEGEYPFELLLRSWGLLFAGAGWAIATLWSVGLSRLIG